MVSGRAPDIVLLILDTVRHSDAPGGASPVAGLPTLERLLRGSVSFPHAFAPAPWTVPSHASLLTGLAPWEHGLHARGRSRLAPDVPTIPAQLRPLGYRSVSLSSNPYLGSSYGLTDGFDEAYWGGWQEPFLRGIPLRPRARGEAARRASLAGLSARQLTDSLATAVQRHPSAWDQLLRLAQHYLPPGTPEGAVSGWIEPTLNSVLDHVPADRPMFSLINLMDAHEPYIGVPGVDEGLGTPRQDRAAWVRGHWSPGPRELAALHGAYRETYRVLDQRLARLEATFRSHGRWDDAVVILTSDHGQAFGEHGILYHGLRPDEALLRVPLMVRWPDGTDAGRTFSQRVSLAAIHDLALDAAAGRAPPWDPDVRPPEPVSRIPTAIADGLLTAPGPAIPDARRRELDRTFVAAYDGPRKVTFEVGAGAWTEFDLERDPMERTPLGGDRGSPPEPLRRHLTAVARDAFGTRSSGVAERLASWGYL